MEINNFNKKTYYQTHKNIILQQRKDYYKNNKEKIKEYNKCRYECKKDELKNKSKNYYQKNKENINKKRRIKYLNNPEKYRCIGRMNYKKNPEYTKLYKKKWILENPEKYRISKRRRWNKYRSNNLEKEKQRSKIYKNTLNGKLSVKKSISKRNRELNFIPLNQMFYNSHAHHINEQYVIFIPKELHLKYYGHNLKNPETMVEINTMSFLYMNPDVYTHLIENYTLK